MSSEEIKILRRKLKKFRENGKLQEISDCCCTLAAYLSDEEEHEEALKLYKESLTCCEKLENKVGAALAHRMIAEECINLGFFEEALKHVTEFLKYAQNEGDKVEEQRGFVLKGHVYFTQAEYLLAAKPRESKKVEQLLEQSMEAYRKSFAICNTELNDISERERLQMKARLLQNKSLVLMRQNKLDYAQAHLIRAIKICTKEKLNDTEHICYLSLGDLYLKKGEPEKALNVYDRALELSHSTQKKRDSLLGKAKASIIMENYQEAKATLKKAYKLRADTEVKKLLKHVASVIQLENTLCSTPDNELVVRKDLYKKLGDANCHLKNYKKGVKCYLNMLCCCQKADLTKNDLIKCYSLLCKAFISDKQYDKALFYSHQEVESLLKWAPEKACKTYLRIAKLHELNGSEFEEIHFAYTNAKNKAQQFENQKLQIKCLKHLISLSQTFNKPDLVEEFKKQLEGLRSEGNDSCGTSDSGNDSESDLSSESDNNSDESSEVDSETLISDSDVENEEYDRPKERCKRTKFTIKRNEKGETDLHVASIKGNYKKVKQLIDQGHPVNIRDTAGWTPLHEACNHGYVDIVTLLLDFGANINDKGGPSCEGTTPLHDAAINGQLEVIDALVKRGASTLVLNDAGETPLQCLLAWKKNTALDADEEAQLQTIIQSLKSPLDSEDIKRHIKPIKSNSATKSAEIKPKTTRSDSDLSDFNPKKSSPVSEYKETIELLRGKRQATNRRSHSEDSDDSIGNSRKRTKSACNEYREAMDEVRHRQKILPIPVKKPKPALINEDEYVENCIVEDDDDDEDAEEKPEMGRLTQRPSIQEEGHSRPRKKMKSSSSFSSSSSSERKSEEKMAGKPESESIDLLEDSLGVLTRGRQDGDSLKFLPRTGSESSVDITVKIFNKRIRIPLNQAEVDKLKVDWLIRALEKKEPTLLNPDNLIILKTEDGALEESDPLSRAVHSEVECLATKWKALPLSERYEKMCMIASHPDMSSEGRAFGFKHAPHPRVVEALRKSSRTRSLTLSNLKLSSLTLIPICKAIKYETFVQSLDLSGNYFGDKGIELIVKIMEKCIIEELNVSGCNVTSTGVYHFADALKGVNELSKNGLEVLDLSNNPITDDAIAGLNNIIELLPNLRTLNIERCELESSVSVSSVSTDLVVVQGNKFVSPRRGTGNDS